MFEIRRLFGRNKLPVAAGAECAAADPIRVLAITQGAEEARTLQAIAGEAGWTISVVPTSAAAARLLDGRPPHIVICDRDLPDENWRDVMTGLAPLPEVACVVLASTVSDEYLWDEVIQCRGYDVVVKPFDAEGLRRTLKFAWSWRRWSGDGRQPLGVPQPRPLHRKR